MFVWLPRPDDARGDAATVGAGAAPRRRRPGRKIKARLFYVADDGTQADERRARRAPTARAPVEQAREIIAAQIAPVVEPLVSAVPPGRRCARCSSPKAARRSSISSRDVRHARIRGGTLDELLTVYTHRERADREPAGRHRRAGAGRRQGGRDAVRPHRSAASAREESRVGYSSEATCDPTSDRRTSSATRRITPELPDARRRLGADQRGQHQGHLHGERRGSRAAVPAQHRQGLGDRRVRHAAARHQHAHAARGVAAARSAAGRRRFSG